MTLTASEIVRQRLYNQRLAQHDFAVPGHVVRWFGAVQAQEFAGALYGVGLRLSAADEAVVEWAIAEKSIVRSWPMRGTIHFMPPEDARWMLRLLAERVNQKYRGLYARAGLTAELFAEAGGALEDMLCGGKQLTRKEIYTRLAAAGIPLAGETTGLHILGYWAQQGLICFGPHRGRQPTFTLLEEWLPPGRDLAGKEALAELARRYFTSHGPATLHDFAWWSGLTMAETRAALAASRSELVEQTCEGRSYYSGPLPDGPETGSGAHLLPSYDEFTVAYRDRSAFMDPAHAGAEVMNGIGPTIILDGRMVGTWRRTRSDKAVTVTLQPFRSLDDHQQEALARAAARYAAFLRLPLVLETVSPRQAPRVE